jgi:hypothetical protein
MKRSELVNTLSKVFRYLRARKTVVVVLIVMAGLLLPQSSQGQFLPSPCCALLATGLGNVTSAITNVIGSGLSAIRSTMNTIETFQRTVVWPQDLINEAKATVGSVRGIATQVRTVNQIPVASATLPNPKQLERTLLSADSAEVPHVGANYAAVYLTAPAPADATPQVRNLIDMTDAVAQAAMKRAIEIDAIADLEIQASDQILQQVQSAAPGSAPILEAGAAAWLVRANAYTQSAMTELMRLRAIDLANAGAEMKIDAQHGAVLRGNVTDALKRR